jgi:hypothetical protein
VYGKRGIIDTLSQCKPCLGADGWRAIRKLHPHIVVKSITQRRNVTPKLRPIFQVL